MNNGSKLEPYKGMNREIVINPGFDKRNSEPGKNYGVGSAIIGFHLQGAKGSVQFELFTGWYPTLVEKEWKEKDYHGKPFPSSLGYHWKAPRYEEHIRSDDCNATGTGYCYFGDSVLNAEEPFEILTMNGQDALWEFLYNFYNQLAEEE